MNLNEPNPALRRIRTRFYAAGVPLAAAHVFGANDLKILKPDGTVANASALPVPSASGAAGSFDIQIAQVELNQIGLYTWQLHGAGVDDWDWHDMVASSGSTTGIPYGAAPADAILTDVAGDLALAWSNTTGDADLSVLAYASDLASDRGLLTAALLSLFTDRRANDDDAPPSGDVLDRRGWWADQFAAVAGDKMGSRLWLLARSILTNETVLLATQYVNEALQWMLDDKVVGAIDVTVTRMNDGLLIAGALSRPGRDPVAFRFAYTWTHLQGEI